MSFAGKIVAITGAAGGIGQAICQGFAEEGASIAAIDRNPSVHDFAAALLKDGIAAEAEVVDVGNAGAVAGAFQRLARRGVVEVLVNNAGFSNNATFAKTDPARWSEAINGNLNGAYNCAYAVLPGMRARGGGVIVNIGSVNALSALGDPAYGAAKAGMISMTRSLALEYGRYGVRVNIVLPGTVRTPLWNKRMKKTRRCWRLESAGIPSAASSSRSTSLARSSFSPPTRPLQSPAPRFRRLRPDSGQHRHGARIDPRGLLRLSVAGGEGGDPSSRPRSTRPRSSRPSPRASRRQASQTSAAAAADLRRPVLSHVAP